MGKGKGAKRPHKCVHGFILGVKRSLAVIKGQLNCGEVKGDWLVSGEGTLAGVTQARCKNRKAGLHLQEVARVGLGTASHYLSPRSGRPNH